MKKTLLAAMAMVSLCGHAQLLNEGFETWPVTGWTTHSNGSPGVGITWQQANGTVTQPAYSGSHAAYLDKENVPDGTLAQDWLVTPLVQIPPVNGAVTFASRLTIAGDQGSIYKLMLLPATGNPAILSDYVVLKQWTETELNPVQTDYVIKNVAIPVAYSAMAVRFAFYMEGDDGDRWLVDDVGITSACEAPTQLAAMNITNTSAQIDWVETGTATQWEVEIVPESDVPTGQGVIVTEKPYTVTDLTPGIYKVYVKSLCPDGGVSEWVGPLSFSLGNQNSQYNQIHGVIRFDSNDDGICNEADTGIPNAQIIANVDGVYAFTVYSNEEGQYTVYEMPEGIHTFTLDVAPVAGFPDIPTVTEVIEFNNEVDEWNVSHCVLQVEGVDLGVYLTAYGNPVPGFDINYPLTIQNAGNSLVENVSVTVNFDAARLTYLPTGSFFPAVLSGNTLTINIGSMQPFTAQQGVIKFHVMEPPVNVGQEILTFTTTLSEVAEDINMSNNTAVYNDVVTNSFDPNDITVHEGEKIFEEQADDYLTYTIRFQNTGNGNAINIRLENTLDALFDWSTFEPLSSSHPYTVNREDNQLEFLFENIQLPFEDANEPASHGFVMYKVKPKPEFGLGDFVLNTAEIYFDFNPAIITNTAKTEVVATAGLNDNAIAIARLYPNPVKDQLHIAVNQGELQSVTIHDLNGRLCLSANSETIDINTLNSGIYFVKVTTDAGSANYKIVKQ
jgi:hypothetical protein